MGIDTERDIEANLQIGPTDQGMVRLFIEAEGQEIPMDFSPDEAVEIAEEIRAAAQAAADIGRGGKPAGKGHHGGGKPGKPGGRGKHHR